MPDDSLVIILSLDSAQLLLQGLQHLHLMIGGVMSKGPPCYFLCGSHFLVFLCGWVQAQLSTWAAYRTPSTQVFRELLLRFSMLRSVEYGTKVKGFHLVTGSLQVSKVTQADLKVLSLHVPSCFTCLCRGQDWGRRTCPFSASVTACATQWLWAAQGKNTRRGAQETSVTGIIRQGQLS